MKKLILIALAFVSLQAVAQDKLKVEKKADRKVKAEKMKNMSAEDQATIATKRLTLALDLDEKQQVQVKEVMLSQTTLRKQKMAQKAEMRNAKDVKKVSEASKVESINEKLDQKIEVKKKMKAILSAEQYKKWEGLHRRGASKAKNKDKMKAKH